MTKKTVWVLGSSNIDTTYYVDTLPEPGQTIFAKSCFTGTGGKGANQAIAAAHFGSDVSFIGAIGDDKDGETLLNSLKAYEIDTQHVEVVENEKSGNAVIFVDKKGANFISVFPGANQHVPLSTIDENLFQSGDFIIAQLEVNMDVIKKAFSRARKSRVTTILNPSPYHESCAELLEYVDILVANESEGEMLTGIVIRDEHSALAAALELLKAGVKNVVITLGESGVLLTAPEQIQYFPAHSVDVVDSQGAGDAFLGTMVSQLFKEASIHDAVALANYVAAISVTREGSTQACLPDFEVLDLSYDDKRIAF